MKKKEKERKAVKDRRAEEAEAEEAEAEEAEEEEEEEMEMERRAFKLAHISRKLSENMRLYQVLQTRRERKKAGSGRQASTRSSSFSGMRPHRRGSIHGVPASADLDPDPEPVLLPLFWLGDVVD